MGPTETTFSKIWTFIKTHLMLDALAIVVIAAIVYSIAPVETLACTIAGYTALVVGGGLGLYFYLGGWVGVYNLWARDNSKGLAIFYGIVFLAFTVLLVYLFAVVAPRANM